MKSTKSDTLLFFICPFSQIESLIRKNFGDVYFITAPASIFRFDDESFAQEIADFIARRDIHEIYFVSDVDSYFIANALSNGHSFGLSGESVIAELIDQSDSSFTLSHKIIEHQFKAIKNASRLDLLIKNKPIKISGMIASKKEGKLTPTNE